MPIISRSNKYYDTLFSIDSKAEKTTTTTACLVATDSSALAPTDTTITTSLVAVDNGALASTSITTTACLVAIDNGIPANVCLIDSGVLAPALLSLAWLQQITTYRLLLLLLMLKPILLTTAAAAPIPSLPLFKVNVANYSSSGLSAFFAFVLLAFAFFFF